MDVEFCQGLRREEKYDIPGYIFPFLPFFGSRHEIFLISSPPTGKSSLSSPIDQISNVACFRFTEPIRVLFDDDGTSTWRFSRYFGFTCGDSVNEKQVAEL